MMRTPRHGGLDTLSEVVFHAVQHQGGVINGIDLRSRQRS